MTTGYKQETARELARIKLELRVLERNAGVVTSSLISEACMKLQQAIEEAGK